MSSSASSFLSVYSEKQGSKNLAALLSAVPFLLLTAVYFLCYGLLNLDAQGVDTRDAFDDFRQTLPACSLAHWWGNASAVQVPVPEVASGSSDALPLVRSQVIADGVGDPRSYFISGSRLAMFLPGTQHAYMSFSGTVSTRSSAVAAVSWTSSEGWNVPNQLLSVFVPVSHANFSLGHTVRSQRFSRVVSRQTSSGALSFAVADVEVPLVSLRVDASGALNAHVVSDVWVELSQPSPALPPALLRVYSKFHPQPLQTFPQSTPSSAATFQISGLNSASFALHVVDINQPRPFVPNFAFSFQWVVAGAVLIAVALLLLVLHLYLRCWVVVNNVRANTGNLPICFASMPEYRGW